MIRIGQKKPVAMWLGQKKVAEVWLDQKKVWPEQPYDSLVEYARFVLPTTNLLPLGYTINDDLWTIEVDGMFSPNGVNWRGFFSAYTNETSQSTRLICYQTDVSSVYAGYRRQANSQTRCVLDSGNTISVRNKWRLSREKLVVERHSDQHTQTFTLPAPSGTYQAAQTLNLQLSDGFSRIYSFKVWHDGVLMVDLLPARIGDEVCFYDTVSGTVKRATESQRQYGVPGPDIDPIGVRRVQSSVSQYVQDGLVAMWDAVENAGVGLHSQNATAWKNLGTLGSTYDFTLGGDCFWNPHSMIVGEYTGRAWSPMIPREQIRTMEIVFRPRLARSITTNDSRTRAFMFGDRFTQNNYQMTRRMLAWDVNSNKRGWMFGTGEAMPAGQANYTRMPYGPDLKTFSVAYPADDTVYLTGDRPSRIVQDGATWSVSSWVNEGDAVEQNQVIGNPLTSSGDEIAKQGIVMQVHCVRLYSRELTLAEQQANYALDVQRYG